MLQELPADSGCHVAASRNHDTKHAGIAEAAVNVGALIVNSALSQVWSALSTCYCCCATCSLQLACMHARIVAAPRTGLGGQPTSESGYQALWRLPAGEGSNVQNLVVPRATGHILRAAAPGMLVPGAYRPALFNVWYSGQGP